MKMKPHKALACSYMLYFTRMCKKKPFTNKMLGFGFLILTEARVHPRSAERHLSKQTDSEM